MMVKMIQDVGKIMEKVQEMFNKDLEDLKNKQTEMNTTLKEINSRITEAKEEINDLEGQNGGNHCCITEYRKKDEKK